MNTTRLFSRLALLLSLVLGGHGGRLLAGQYFQDFTTSDAGATTFTDGSALFSDQLGTTAAVRDATFKELALTAANGFSTHSAFRLPDLDPGTPVYAFSARWNSQVYGNFPDAADGFSFNFGQLGSTDLVTATTSQEAGYGTGLSFGVQTFFGNNPGFYLRSGGTVVASSARNPTTQWGNNNNKRHLFEVDWSFITGLTVRVDGVAIFTGVPTPGFTPQAGDRFVWAARTGGFTEEVRLDNVLVVTGGTLVKVPTAAPYFQSSETTPSQTADKAFDDFISTQWLTTVGPPGFVGATASVVGGHTVRAYALSSALLDRDQDPRNWRLEGSNDGSNDGLTWTGLGNGGGSFVNGRETRFWLGTGASPFAAFRLNIGVNNGGAAIQLAELALYELAPARIVTVTDDATLRAALTGAQNGDILRFANDITVTGHLPAVNLALGIAGNGHTLNGNRAAALFNVRPGAKLTLQHLTITGGIGTDFVTRIGGGIFSQGTVLAEDCTVSGNSAVDDGGIENEGTLMLTHCTVSGNSASLSGGGIHNSGTVTLTQCTVSDNKAGQGGAIVNFATLNLTHTTVSGNQATSQGGAIYNYAGTLTLANSIVAGNTAPTGPNISNEATVTRTGANLIGTALDNLGGLATDSGPAAFTGDPRLGPLANYGGPTMTMALLGLSPAINAAVGSTITSDQRGLPIVGTPDLGAFEAQLINAGVGFNFVGGGGGGPGGTLAATEVAGAPGFAQAHWNNLFNFYDGVPDGTYSSGPNPLQDAAGADFSPNLRLWWAAPQLWSRSGDPTTPDEKLMWGYLDSNGAIDEGTDLFDVQAKNQPFFAVADLPPALTLGGYQVLVYADGAGNDHVSEYWLASNRGTNPADVSGESDLTPHRFRRDDMDFSGTFTEVPASSTTDLGGATPQGNVLRFGGLVEPGFTVRSREGGYINFPRAEINAVQIVRNEILVVTIAADENDANGTLGTGLSLREALRDAPDGAGIIFDSALDGATLTLGSHLVLAKNVVIDASNLPAGLTLSGNHAHRIFTVNSGRTVALRGLTLTEGNAGGLDGGGAIYNSGALTLTQCTVSGNTSSTTSSGGIYNGGTLTLENSIVAGNTAPTDPDIYNIATITPTGVNFIGDNATVATIFPEGPLVGTTANPKDPRLAPLANYGGPTMTMALLPDSPAINAAVGSTVTHDQRGSPIVGTPDLGAFEQQAPPTVTITPHDPAAIIGDAFFLTAAPGEDGLSFQWKWNGNDIPGANGPSFAFGPTAEWDNGDTLGVTVKRPADLLTASDSVTLTVVPPLIVTSAADSGPGSLRQTLANAAAVPGPDTIRFNLGNYFFVESVVVTSTTTIEVTFSQSVDPSSATDPFAYVVTTAGGGSAPGVVSVTMQPTPRSVSLELDAPLVPGTSYAIAIEGVSDILSPPGTLAPTTVSITGTVGAAGRVTSSTFPPIVLTSGELPINDPDGVTLDGSDVDGGVTLSGNHAHRIFTVNSGRSLGLRGLTLTEGNEISTGGGGAIRNDGGTVTLSQCTVSDNTASFGGGGISNENGSVTLTQCTLSGNQAGSISGGAGGAIANSSGTVSLSHCTLSGNTVFDAFLPFFRGGAIANAGTLILNNTIVAGNTALFGADIYDSFPGTITPTGVNFIGDNATVATIFPEGPLVGTTANPKDPRLGPLANYGGPTMTMALLPDSPAINAAVGSTVTHDQRGFPTVGTPDLGAFEFQNTPPVLGLPAPITVEATGPGGETVSFTITATDAENGPFVATATPASGSLFPLGVTTVNVTATDSGGLTATGSLTVTVRDTTPPLIQCPTDQTLPWTTGALPHPPLFLPTVSDLVDSSPILSFADVVMPATPPAVHVLLRTWTATDASLNSASCSQTITFANVAPVAGADVITRLNTAVLAKVPLSVLLENDSDANHDPLSITAVGHATQTGPGTATVVLAGNFVVYTASSADAGNGSFEYTLSDGTHSVTGTVTVTATAVPGGGDGTPNALSIREEPVGTFTVTFIAVPGLNYEVEYTTDVSPPRLWHPFDPPAAHTAGPNGVFLHTDVNPPGPQRFYRAVLAPVLTPDRGDVK